MLNIKWFLGMWVGVVVVSFACYGESAAQAGEATFVAMQLSPTAGVVFLKYTSTGQGDWPTLLPEQIVMVKWSQAGDRYVTGHVDGSVRIYENDALLTAIPAAHTDRVFGLAFSPDSSRLATGGFDGMLKVWNVSNGNLLAEFNGVGRIISVFWAFDGSYIWAIPATGEDTLVTADISTDTYTFDQNLRVASADDVVWKPDQSVIAFAGVGADIVIIDPVSYSILRILDATPNTNFFEPPNEAPWSIAWHPTANIVADGKINGWIHVWDLNSPSDDTPMLSLEANNGATDDAVVPFEYAVRDIIFSGDDSTISSLSADGTLRAWDATTGTLLADSNLGEQILAAAFSPDGRQLVYSTYSQTDVLPIVVELPTADAGPDQTLTDSDDDGSELVTLDGTGSSDPDGTIESYVWTEDEVEIATGVTPQVNLSVGVHTITLTVTDDDGLTDTDEVVITVSR